MSVRRLTGTDHSIWHAAAACSTGIVALRRNADARTRDPVRPHPARGETWSGRGDRHPQDTAAGLLEHDVAAGGPSCGRPRFARLHASIAERRLDWAWQNYADSAEPPDEAERSGARRTDKGFSARALWLGGIAFGMLAAGLISVVATVQSSRPLPFETWARGDLTQRADGLAGARPTDGTAGASVAAPTAAAPAPAIDAALGSHVRLEPSDVDVAGLGPILATAAAAEELASNLTLPSVPTVAGGSGAEGLLAGPPRPVFKPMLVSSSHGEREAVPSEP